MGMNGQQCAQSPAFVTISIRVYSIRVESLNVRPFIDCQIKLKSSPRCRLFLRK